MALVMWWLLGLILSACWVTYFLFVRHVRAKRSVLLFDGVCNLCNATVNFLIAHDQRHLIRFAPLQSEYAQAILRAHAITLDSVVLVQDEETFTQSDAVLRVCAVLDAPFFLLACLYGVPRIIRDPVYRLVGRWRHTVFGSTAECRRPTPDLKSRFID